MSGMADFVVDGDAGNQTVSLSGGLTLARMGDLPERLAQLSNHPASLDLKGVDRVDTVGAWVLYRYAEQTGARITSASEDALRLIEHVKLGDNAMPMHAPTPPSFQRVLGEIASKVRDGTPS